MRLFVECIVADGKGLEWRKVIERDAVLGVQLRFTKPVANVFSLDSESPLFDRLVEVTAPFGIGFRPGTVLDKNEDTRVRFFTPESTRWLWTKMSDKDQDSVWDRIRAMPQRSTAASSAGIRLLDDVMLSRLEVRSNTISVFVYGAQEFAFAADVAKAVSRAELSGYDRRAIRNRKTGEEFQEAVQLFTDRVLDPAEAAPNTKWVTELEDRWFHLVDLLAYRPDVLDRAADFNQTAEPWSYAGVPGWVVSRRVRTILTDRKTRGWRFRPVLEVGTDLYDDYLRRWRELLRKLSQQEGRYSLHG